MPRISDTRREARRDQILAAAQRCFARNGFHATSMHDVIAEAGLSVGAVYRYFRSKDELRAAVAERNLLPLLGEIGAVAATRPPLPLAEAMTRVVDVVESRLAEPDSILRIAVQAWGEALRDPDLGQMMATTIGAIREAFVTIARSAEDLPAGTDPESAGAVLMAIVPGYILQRLLTGGPDRDAFVAALHALLDR